MDLSGFPLFHATIRSGSSSKTFSISKRSNHPITGNVFASGGKSLYSITPTTLCAAPIANRISVRDGARLITRSAGLSSLTRLPSASRISMADNVIEGKHTVSTAVLKAKHLKFNSRFLFEL